MLKMINLHILTHFMSNTKQNFTQKANFYISLPIYFKAAGILHAPPVSLFLSFWIGKITDIHFLALTISTFITKRPKIHFSTF